MKNVIEQLKGLRRDLDESVWIAEMEGEKKLAAVIWLEVLWAIARYGLVEKLMCRRGHDFQEVDWSHDGYVAVECSRCGRGVAGYWN